MADLGPARVLVALYSVFALAAGARALVQLFSAASRAPVAYVLSAVAAAIYLVAAFALARGARRVALWACSVELAGVVCVGAVTAADPALLGDETVWSRFGAGYGLVPLVLPLLGLAWLARSRTRT